MKRIFATVLAFLLLAQPAFAALVRGTPGTFDTNSNVDPWNGTVTTTSGDDGLIVFCLKSNNVITFDAGTHNGDALTCETIGGNCTSQHSSTALSGTIWYRANPDIGAGLTVSMDLSAANNGGCVYVPYAGINTADLLSNSVYDEEGGASVTSTSITIDCPAGSEILSGAMLASTVTGMTPSNGNTTEIVETDDGVAQYVFAWTPGAGSTAVGWSWTGDRNVVHLATCVNAAAESSSFGPLRRRGQ